MTDEFDYKVYEALRKSGKTHPNVAKYVMEEFGEDNENLLRKYAEKYNPKFIDKSKSSGTKFIDKRGMVHESRKDMIEANEGYN